MPTPNNIKIKFTASGNAIEVIEKLSKVQGTLTKVNQKVAKSQKTVADTSKQLARDFNAESRNAQQTADNLERLNKALKKAKLSEDNYTAANKFASQQDAERLAAREKRIAQEKKLEISAKKLAKAQQHLAVNSKINTDKVHKLDKQLKKLGVSWKDAAVKGGLLRDALRGNAAAMSTVNRAATHLIKKNKKLSSSLFALSNDGRLVIGSFATMRSKMLLFAFASSIITKMFVDQVKAFAKQEASVKRLADVYGSEAAVRLDEFSSELQKNSNFGDENINMVMSQIGAFGASEEQTKTLMQATADLSAGLGLDLNSAGLLVAKTIGSTTDALGRYGVGADGATTQSEKVANVVASVEEKFGGLAKLMSQTTEGQLNQASMAFGDLSETLGQVLLPLVVGAARALQFLAESFSVKGLEAFRNAAIGVGLAILYNNHIKDAAITKNILLASSYVKTSLSAKGLTKTIKLLTAAMIRNPVTAVIVGLTAAATAAFYFFSKTEELTQAKKDEIKATQDAIEAEKERKDSIDNNMASLEKELALLNAKTQLEKAEIELGRKLTSKELDIFNAIQSKNIELDKEKDLLDRVNKFTVELTENKIKKAKADIVETQALIAKNNQLIIGTLEAGGAFSGTAEVTGKYVKVLDELISKGSGLDAFLINLKKQLEDLETTTEETFRSGFDIAQEFVGSLGSLFSEMAQAEMDVAREIADNKIELLNEEYDAKLQAVDNAHNLELEELKNSRAFQKMSASSQLKAIEALNKGKLEKENALIAEKEKAEQAARDRANQEIVKAFKVQQAMDIAQTIMNTAASIIKANKDVEFPASLVVSALYAAMGAAQIGIISSQKPPTMAQGGLIGGNLHSQGGTMINAERGEFVMKRSAVDSIGVESLNRMNQGGGGGVVNINFSGNVLSKDFIEDEAIPQIKEALRRGGDIGIG